tara:strand:- start:623 stop:931 length:309 start_codon:yes stop_codon:yes gene_type:complete
MDAVDDFFKYLNDWGIHLALIIAGGVGAFVRMGKKDELNFWQKSVVILSGGSIANYLTPVVFSWINITEDLKYGFAFLLGFWGQQSVRYILFKFKDKYIDDK